VSERADPKTCLKPAFAGFRQPKVNLNKRKLHIRVKNQHQAEEISALSIALIGFKDSSQIFLTLGPNICDNKQLKLRTSSGEN